MHTRIKYIVLLALFLSAQLMALSHQAEHNFERHQHHDAICAFSLHKPNHILASFSPPATLFNEALIEHSIVANPVSVFLSPSKFYQPLNRAPPIFVNT